MHLIVDGMNVIGSRPDGWWRDRARARRRLVDDLAAAGATLGAEQVTVVFDGRPTSPETVAFEALGTPEVRFAPGGPNAADDAIAELVAGSPAPGTIVVVTSDAGLAARVRESGATVEGASGFRRRLEEGNR
jgi:predicted RNA-binding protein with PIN domain